MADRPDIDRLAADVRERLRWRDGDGRAALDDLVALARTGEGAVIALRESKKMREAAKAERDRLADALRREAQNIRTVLMGWDTAMPRDAVDCLRAVAARLDAALSAADRTDTP